MGPSLTVALHELDAALGARQHVVNGSLRRLVLAACGTRVPDLDMAVEAVFARLCGAARRVAFRVFAQVNHVELGAPSSVGDVV